MINEKEMQKLQEMLEKHENEIAYSLQEWGLKNKLRLFGYDITAMYTPVKGEKATAQGFFTDANFKSMYILFFLVKQKSGKGSVAKEKDGFKYPIKFCKTSEFISERIIPVNPIYGLLIDKGVIFPFKGTIKNKEWQALPFIEKGKMKSVDLYFWNKATAANGGGVKL